MRETTAILWRELVARRDLLWVAVAAMLMAALMPLLPGLAGYTADDVWTTGSVTLALVVGWFIAIGLGATLFGRDLSEGRLGFFFARPVGGFTIWLGKVLAALALVLACELLVLLPALVGGGGATRFEVFGWLGLLGFVGAPLLLLLLVHAVSVMVRARTPWLVLDLLGCIGLVIAGFVAQRPLVEIGAVTAIKVVGGALLVALVVAFAIAGAVGVVVGRSELRRTHGALSLALWAALVLALVPLTAYAHWLHSFEPEELAEAWVSSIAPDGDWVEIGGTAPGHLDVNRRFLFSTIDRRWMALEFQWSRTYDHVVFSRDGRVAVWRRRIRRDLTAEIRWADLGAPAPEPTNTSMEVSRSARYELSPHGERLVILENGLLTITELAGERLLTAVRLPEDLRSATLFFPDRDTVRLYDKHTQGESASIHIAEFNLGVGKVIRTGAIGELDPKFWTAFDAELELLVVGESGNDDKRARRLFDARTGAIIRELPNRVFPTFLSDGRLAWIEGDERAERTLVVASAKGDQRREYSLGAGHETRLRGEVMNGAGLLVGWSDKRGFRAEVVELTSGRRRVVGEGLWRVVSRLIWKEGSVRGLWYVLAPAANPFFIRNQGELVRWDPETGELVHIAGGRERTAR